MSISIFDLFKIGIGPSSSHTVGPMKAGHAFLDWLSQQTTLETITEIEVSLYGSLAWTGVGHGTDTAILLGLSGYHPETIIPDEIPDILATIYRTQKLLLLGTQPVPYDAQKSIRFLKSKQLAEHPNGLIFQAKNTTDTVFSRQYFSIGGGFVLDEDSIHTPMQTKPSPWNFESCDELILNCKKTNMTISEMVLENEVIWQSLSDIDFGLKKIWDTMKNCVEKGCHTDGVLPGGLHVRRRAAKMYQRLQNTQETHSDVMDWVSLFALSVNEENAAGGRVVTAPTNGAAGIIPAVLHYYEKYYQKLSSENLRTFFFTAGAIGILYKKNASISGAEMGCQGEVGVACSMAAGGLAALLGGSNDQIECAAEIGMEHNLGLTCDPVKGLVQIPCIERNAMGAIKAINAARLALQGDGTQIVSLDKVIKTMRQTGEDMKKRYKETSLGGLAINVVAC
jgi:L-serine dehydratase